MSYRYILFMMLIENKQTSKKKQLKSLHTRCFCHFVAFLVSVAIFTKQHVLGMAYYLACFKCYVIKKSV